MIQLKNIYNEIRLIKNQNLNEIRLIGANQLSKDISWIYKCDSWESLIQILKKLEILNYKWGSGTPVTLKDTFFRKDSYNFPIYIYHDKENNDITWSNTRSDMEFCNSLKSYKNYIKLNF